MEEAGAPLALEANAKRILQRSARCRESRCITRRFDPGQPVARVGSKQPRQILRLSQRGPVRKCPDKIFPKARACLAGECAGPVQFASEVIRAFSGPERFELRGLTGGVLTHKHEIAGVGHEDKAIAPPVAAYLIALRGEPGVVVHRLHFDAAAFRYLAFARLAPLQLFGHIEAEIWMARAVIGEVADAEHTRPERRADGAQKPRERPVGIAFPGFPPPEARTRPRSAKYASTAAEIFVLVPAIFSVFVEHYPMCKQARKLVVCRLTQVRSRVDSSSEPLDGKLFQSAFADSSRTHVRMRFSAEPILRSVPVYSLCLTRFRTVNCKNHYGKPT